LDPVTVLMDVVIALWFLAVIVAVVRAWQARPPRLAPLSPEDQNRFTSSWQRIAFRFVDAPRDAAREADALVLSVLMERGHPVRDDALPAGLRKARRWLALEGSDGTEALRQAMLHYRTVLNQMVGPRSRVRDDADGRREMA
jgi:hypothetical protein